MKIKDYKNTFPFKIGTVSYIFPVKKDNLVTNVRRLEGSFNKIQLLYYGKDYLVDVISPAIIDELCRIKANSDIEFTVHMPIDLNLLDGKDEQDESIDIVLNIINETSILNVQEYILHIDGSNGCSNKEIKKLPKKE